MTGSVTFKLKSPEGVDEEFTFNTGLKGAVKAAKKIKWYMSHKYTLVDCIGDDQQFIAAMKQSIAGNIPSAKEAAKIAVSIVPGAKGIPNLKTLIKLNPIAAIKARQVEKQERIHQLQCNGCPTRGDECPNTNHEADWSGCTFKIMYVNEGKWH
jgi:hypothetical protein